MWEGCPVASSMLVFLFHEELPLSMNGHRLVRKMGRRKRSSASQSFSKGSVEFSLLCHLIQKLPQSSSCMPRTCINPSVPAPGLS